MDPLQEEPFLHFDKFMKDKIEGEDIKYIPITDKLNLTSNYDFRFIREYDIIDNINITTSNDNIKVQFYIGGVLYQKEELKEFIFLCSPYNELVFKFIVPAGEKGDVTIEYRGYLFNNHMHRRQLAQNTVKTKYITYQAGVCIKNNYS